MNRKNLTAAVLAGLAGVAGIASSAQAVNINPDGTGEVLLYPYYTTNGGNMTLLSVVNTSDNAKAVKVRFMESENSQEVLDFNLYMSAYDVWTAAISAMPEGAMYDDCDPFPDDDTDVYCEGPLLTIPADETTCTVPLLGGAQPFLPFQYQYGLNDGGDSGTQGQARMNEGHFEMIEMGTLPNDELPGIWATHDHSASGDGEPADCAALVAAWVDADLDADDGAWITDPTFGVEAPSGGLFGGAAIVNVMQGSMHSYDAIALNGWNSTGFDIFGPDLGDSIHAEPGTVEPNLDSGDTLEGKVFSESGQLLLSGDLDSPVDAVSYVLMHDTMMNEYTTEAAVAGQTEWVVTFPTKRFYVFNQGAEAIDPFTNIWAKRGSDTYATACETVELRTMWDREERTEQDPTCEELGNCPGKDDPVVSPPRPGTPPEVDPARVPFELCYETNVIRFGKGSETVGDVTTDVTPDETEILGTPKGMYRNIDNERLGYKYGWARVELDDYLEAIPVCGGSDCTGASGEVQTGWRYEENTRNPLGTGDNALHGLPFIGFSVSRFSNGYIPAEEEGGQDVFSSYGALWKHKSSRKQGSSGY
jgi:hypothetical protein